MSLKIIPCMDSQLSFTGVPGDPYFDHLDVHTDLVRDYLEFATCYVPEAGIVADIGANIGLTTVLLAHLRPDTQIIAFEASPINAAELQRNIDLNHCKNVTAIAEAVGDTAGHLHFFHALNGAESRIATEAHLKQGAMNTISIPVTPFDAAFARQNLKRLDLVKIDVEGFEIEALRGMDSSLQQYKPIAFMEFNSWTTMSVANRNPRELMEAFRARFKTVYAVGKNPSVFTIKQLATDEDVFWFLHDNVVKHGCVNDLIGVPEGRMLAVQDIGIKRWATEQKRRVALNTVLQELNAIKASTSWRITAPLRRLARWLRR